MVMLTEYRIDQSVASFELGDDLVFRVDPNSIRKLIKKECLIGNDWLQQKPFFDFFIVGGDWDLDFSLVENDRNFIEMKELIEVRGDFKSSNARRICVEELQAGCPQKGIDGTHFKSIADVDESFSFYLDLIYSMESVGYLPVLTTRKCENEHHIGVGVARDGELFHFRTGHHRLAIGRLLNLNSVMVHVHCVHSQWAAKAVAEYGGTELEAIKFSIKRLAKEMEVV